MSANGCSKDLLLMSVHLHSTIAVAIKTVAVVCGGRGRGRPRLGWMNGVKAVLGNRGMTVEAARQSSKDRKEWRALVHM